MYFDALKPLSLVRLALQEDTRVDIVQGIKHILKSVSMLRALVQQDPLQWTTVKLVIYKITTNESEKLYQGSVLTQYSDSMLSRCTSLGVSDLQKLDSNIRDRLAWSDVELLHSIHAFLNTSCWISTPKPAVSTVDENSDTEQVQEDADDKAEIRAAMHCIASVFRKPLELKRASLFLLDDELDDAIDYCRNYLDCKLEDYHRIWYTLHTTENAIGGLIFRSYVNFFSACPSLTVSW